MFKTSPHDKMFRHWQDRPGCRAYHNVVEANTLGVELQRPVALRRQNEMLQVFLQPELGEELHKLWPLVLNELAISLIVCSKLVTSCSEWKVQQSWRT